MGAKKSNDVVIVGAGPAGLMAATVIARAGHSVRLIEKRAASGRKLLVAGSSGLNITHESDPEDVSAEKFSAHYRESANRLRPYLQAFPPSAWLSFVESLGVSTFRGTSRRWFVRQSDGPETAPTKATGLIKEWMAELRRLGVIFEGGCELTSFENTADGQVRLKFADGHSIEAAAVCLALGGGSWEPKEKPLRWPSLFFEREIPFKNFEASNAGCQVAWPRALLEEADGKPVKNVTLTTSRGSRPGDLIITSYGLEGTPVYSLGIAGPASLDLKPDLELDEVVRRMRSVRENLSPLRRAKKRLGLSEGALAILFHLTPQIDGYSVETLAARIKKFSLEIGALQPLDEAISSRGGVEWSALSPSLELIGYRDIRLAGEMIDWDAPTGGFLIQACVSLGHAAGSAVVDSLSKRG